MNKAGQVKGERTDTAIRPIHPAAQSPFVSTPLQAMADEALRATWRAGRATVPEKLGGRASAPIRQAMVIKAQRLHGNRVTRRLIQREDGEGGGGFQLPEPTLTLPRPQPPTLGVPALRLDPALFPQQPIQSAVPVNSLLQPTPEMLNNLVQQWVAQYRLRQPAFLAAAPQDWWSQLWSAWRRLTDQWIARGAEPLSRPEMAQDLLRDNAAERLQALARQLSGEEQPEVSVGDIAGQVWPAFQQALEATEFYPRLRTRAGELAQEHWPAFIPLVGAGLTTSLMMGIRGGDWRSAEFISSNLLTLVDTEIPLSGNLGLILRFGESEAIGREEGVTIGLRPTVGLHWRFEEGRELTIEGDTNLRFQTDQESERGFQFNFAPGLTVGGRF
ncbi:MAG: hypothetical protein AB1791_16455 [Chloroflexota bacterium]